MKKGILGEKRYRWIPVVLMLGAILVNIKSIFTDFDVDSEYAVVMAYRMVQGDRMIAQMWEPHQTSSFLCAIFIKIYMTLFGTTTGIVLYLHVLGVGIKGLFTYMLYKTTKRYVNPTAVFYMCIFFFSVFPKGIPMPEFSNMQLWFSVGLFCCLLRYMEEQTKILWLVAAGIFLLLEVLAYPSCLIVYVAVVIVLWMYTCDKWKNIFVLTGTCLSLGGCLCGWIISYTGLELFVKNLNYILRGDASHSEPLWQKLLSYFQELGSMLLLLVFFAVAAWILQSIIFKVEQFQKKEIHISCKECWCVLFAILLLIFVLVHTLLVYDRHGHLVIYLPILFMALGCQKYNQEKEKLVVHVGMLISIFSFVATLMLSNLPLNSSMSYLILAICVSFIPAVHVLDKMFEKRKEIAKYALLWSFCGIIILRSGYIFKPMNAYIAGIYELRGIVKGGPACGIVSEYMGPYIINTSMEEWKQYVRKSDRVLLVGNGSVSTLGYLYEDTVISVDSTICTPTYDEKLLEYWRQNPEKFPNVVIVDCWFGECKLEEDSWIMQWIEEEFQPDECVDGKYWRYYRVNE